MQFLKDAKARVTDDSHFDFFENLGQRLSRKTKWSSYILDGYFASKFTITHLWDQGDEFQELSKREREKEIKKLQNQFELVVDIKNVKIADQKETGGCSFIGGIYNLYRCSTQQYNSTKFLKNFINVWKYYIMKNLEREQQLIDVSGLEAVMSVYHTLSSFLALDSKKMRRLTKNDTKHIKELQNACIDNLCFIPVVHLSRTSIINKYFMGNKLNEESKLYFKDELNELTQLRYGNRFQYKKFEDDLENCKLAMKVGYVIEKLLTKEKKCYQ